MIDDVTNRVLSPPVVLMAVTDFEPVQIRTFSHLSELINALRELKSGPGPVQVFMVQGSRWHITSKPKPTLISPDGEQFDLSETDTQVMPDLDGYLLPPTDNIPPSELEPRMDSPELLELDEEEEGEDEDE